MHILFRLNQNKTRTFNHIQTIDEEKKNKAKRKGRQRSFGNYNNWLIFSNNEIDQAVK
jgi:hypothetical protein